MTSKDDSPKIANTNDVVIDSEYVDWISDIKQRYKKTLIRASVKVHAERLLFNWHLGQDIVKYQAEQRWGTSVVDQISFDLRNEFPDSDGFSVRNIRYMKQWYLFYTQSISNGRLLELCNARLVLMDKTDTKLNKMLGELAFVKMSQSDAAIPPLFALVPWGQHIEIISRCQSVEEAVFYIGKTIEMGWSRVALLNGIKSNLYASQAAKAVNNFSDYFPPLESKLTEEIFKESYDFGFATVNHSIYKECELEDALAKNITDLLLELGNGFAFIGRQKEVIVGGSSRKIDLLFYHIRLRCYIVCELKVKPFQPEFVGKLNYYVSAVDELLKHKDDNPTIGLMICSDMDKTDVQWSFRGVTTPMGVAVYNNIRVQDVLPTQEQLKMRMDLLTKELRSTKRLLNKK